MFLIRAFEELFEVMTLSVDKVNLEWLEEKEDVRRSKRSKMLEEPYQLPNLA